MVRFLSALGCLQVQCGDEASMDVLVLLSCVVLIPGGKRRDTQMASSGSFWNTKGRCLRHLMNLFPAMSNFTMMVRLCLLQEYSICTFIVQPGDGMYVGNKTFIYFTKFR